MRRHRHTNTECHYRMNACSCTLITDLIALCKPPIKQNNKGLLLRIAVRAIVVFRYGYVLEHIAIGSPNNGRFNRKSSGFSFQFVHCTNMWFIHVLRKFRRNNSSNEVEITLAHSSVEVGRYYNNINRK